MIDSLQFLFYVYAICIWLAVSTLFITLFFIVPLQFEKAGVQNGLSSLRKKLLIKGLLSVLMSVVTIVILSSRFFVAGELARYLNTGLIFCFTLIWFVKQLIESSIYHTQFTEDQIELHHKIHVEEVRQEKVKRNRKA